MTDQHPDTDQESDRPTSRGFSWITTLWIGAIVVALYVLSVGPVAKMYDNKGKDVPKTVQVFYAPIEFLYERVPIVERGLDWYLELWGVK